MTPLRRQYLRLKRQHPDTILFFRLGDFYETFDDDAERAARLLQITLTSREMGRGNRVPMAGVPAHAAEAYIARLIAAGERVAVCEQVAPESRAPTRSGQVATPDAHDGGRGGARLVRQETRRGARRASAAMMERKVVRVVTPGTVAEPDMLTAARNNYLCAVAAHGRQAGLAYADVSTGEFAADAVRRRAMGHRVASGAGSAPAGRSAGPERATATATGYPTGGLGSILAADR